MTRRSAEEQAAWVAARDRVATYHEQELAALVECLRSGLERLDAGEIDGFEFDESFCVGGREPHPARRARVLEHAEADGETFYWWEAGSPDRRQ